MIASALRGAVATIVGGWVGAVVGTSFALAVVDASSSDDLEGLVGAVMTLTASAMPTTCSSLSWSPR